MAERLRREHVVAMLEKLRRDLSPDELTRLLQVVELLEVRTRQARVSAVLANLFPDAGRDAANKALARLRGRVNSVARERGMELVCAITETRSRGAESRYVWFEGDALSDVPHETRELDSVGERFVAGQRGEPISTEPRIELSEQFDGKPIVRWFLSYAHADAKEKTDFLKRLRTQLKNSPRFHFEVWDDGELVAGEDWLSKIREALKRSHVGVLLISHEFLARDFILREELPAFVTGHGAGAEGKRVVPVALKSVVLENTDLKGLDARQIFRDKKHKAFVERSGHKRDEWIGELVDDLHKLLARYADVLPVPTSAEKDFEEVTARELNIKPCALMSSHAMLSGDLSANEARLIEKVSGRLTTLRSGIDPSAATESAGIDVFNYLNEWLNDPNAPKLFALLGEYGMGKTITCQRLVRSVEKARGESELSGLPEPLYFDLRKLTGLRERPIRNLYEILDECIQRGWQRGDELPLPTAEELVGRSRDQALLFVFDGLDEALVHMSEIDGQVFTRELLRLHMPKSGKTQPISATRILISCRTHFFRTLQAQNNHFTGQERDTTPASEYRALVLLPFGEEQVRSYFEHALPGVDPDATLELVRSVHNLTELSCRPFTLKLVAELIPELERLRIGGQPVYGVTLYRTMVERWLQRDQGKHHLKPEHKVRLMTHLAAWMWRRGERLITADMLEPWFHEWLEGQPDLRLRYAQVDRDKLEEDLRTATFLVREDAASDDDAPASLGGFRFAHSSMHEYFLARHMYEALLADRRQDWVMPQVSEETLEFFAQSLLENPGLVQRLSGWRAPYLAQASELWLRYAVRAGAKDWPEPALVGADLRGANLHGWCFEGRKPTLPINFSCVDLRGAELRETIWHNVRLEQARLDDAHLERSEWQGVHAPGASFARACCDGATFRGCTWPNAAWEGARGHRVSFLWTEVPSSWRDGTAGHALVAPRGRDSEGVVRGVRCTTSLGHSRAVTACAFSPDGARVVSASYDNCLKLWDVAAGQCLATWAGHAGTVTACAFSPDGTRIISASHDHSLKLWDIESGKCLATWTGHARAVSACMFSPDGARVISASHDNNLKLWDAESGQCLATWAGHKEPVTACAFSPDGARVVSASYDNCLKLWDSKSGQCLATWAEHEMTVAACAFSPDGTRVVSASYDVSLKLWDADSGQCLATWAGHGSFVSACAYSPDGAHVVSASYDSHLKLWDAESGQCLATWAGNGSFVTSCAFSPDGSRLVSASYDNDLKLWDAKSGQCLATWAGNAHSAIACAFSPDGARIISANSDISLTLWDAASGQCLSTWAGHESRLTAHAFSPDGSRVVSASLDNKLKLWDADSGQCLATWAKEESLVTACAFSPDGARVVSAGFDGDLKLWNADSGQLLATSAVHVHEGFVNACAFSPDGARIVFASHDGHNLQLWDVHSGQRLTTLGGHASAITELVFSPDGARVISASRDTTLKLWDSASGQCLATWAGHESFVRSCAFSPDGARVISASDDNNLKLWDAASGQCLATWTGHESGVNACAFSPDGTRVISASDDNSLKVWDVATGRAIRHHQMCDGDHAVWDLDQQRLIEASEEAWRWLRWQIFSPTGELLDILPAETFGELPAPLRQRAK